MIKLAISICFLLFTAAGIASELIYTPKNPSFGGNPANGNYLLGKSQAQNNKRGPSSSRSSRTSDLERFNASLESRLLSQLLADIGQGGTNNGVLETSDFLVEVVQGDDGNLVVRTTDKNTGESTEINVSGLIAD